MSHHTSTCAAAFALSEHPKSTDLEALRQFRRVYGDIDVFLFVKEGVEDVDDTLEALSPGNVQVVRTHGPGQLRNHRDHDSFAVDPATYRTFGDFKYVMTWQSDAWAFRDDLSWWEDMDCDYYAAPWATPGANKVFAIGAKARRGGCSGFALRKVSSFLRVSEDAKKAGFNPYDHPGEDIFASGIVEHRFAHIPGSLKFPPYLEQLRFCWNNPGWPNVLGTDVLLKLNNLHLPSAVHQPSQEFYNEYCIPYGEPDVIFILSSALGERDDWASIVDQVPPSRRLVVALNHCNGLFKNRSAAKRVLGRDRRLITMHNDSVEKYWGFAGKRDTLTSVGDLGFRGCHETICLQWRPGGRDGCVATYDGEIRCDAATRVLRGIKDMGGLSPTAGYMAYKILRDRYPKAKFRLINFFGNTKEHPVNFRHDTNAEQNAYAADPLVERVFTSR